MSPTLSRKQIEKDRALDEVHRLEKELKEARRRAEIAWAAYWEEKQLDAAKAVTPERFYEV